MATEKITSVDQLSKDERSLLVSSLILMASSLSRAAKAERDEVVRERRLAAIAAVDALKARLS